MIIDDISIHDGVLSKEELVNYLAMKLALSYGGGKQAVAANVDTIKHYILTGKMVNKQDINSATTDKVSNHKKRNASYNDYVNQQVHPYAHYFGKNTYHKVGSNI